MRKGTFLTLGIPLVDVIVSVDDGFLQKYDLQPNNAIAAGDQHKNLFLELENLNPKYNAGGCSLNTARSLQRVLKTSGVSTVVGIIGSDNYGTILKDKLREDGVCYIFDEIDTEETGKCAVLLTGDNRSLCTNLAASRIFSSSHLESERFWKAVAEANYFYVPGFFFRVSPESVFMLAEHSLAEGKTFAFNLSAPFLCKMYAEEMKRVFPFVNILFGNELEARSFAKMHQFSNENLEDILPILGGFCNDNKLNRIVVVTRGSSPVYVWHNRKVTHYPVNEVLNIVDTTSAGDAFVGGFMAMLMEGKPVSECVVTGIKIAEEVIQCVGCNFKTRLFL